MTDIRVAAKIFLAKDYAKALQHKEDTGAIMTRIIHPTMGVCYEVRYIPPIEIPDNLKSRG